jgi:prepilin-type N-terminal cleavage/methylation domain-containing protein
MKKRNGFTLIELLIVIAIIVIVATIIIVQIQRAREKSLDSSFQSTAHSVQRALSLCCSTPGTALGSLPGGLVCVGSDRYPGSESIGSITGSTQCGVNGSFTKIIEPGSGNAGSCVQAVLTQDEVAFDGC